MLEQSITIFNHRLINILQIQKLTPNSQPPRHEKTLRFILHNKFHG